MAIPLRQIRAHYGDRTIRVYQAYSNAIANTAIKHQAFVSPPFSMERMTWIKPSFLWMMYRAGWGQKDDGQKRILAIDITREGFEWALGHSCLSHPGDQDKSTWKKIKAAHPVRIQWDPERNLRLAPLEHRSIQIGLSKQAVVLYCQEWIQAITDITPQVQEIHGWVQSGDLEEAIAQLPTERPYPLSEPLRQQIQASEPVD